MHRSSSSLNQSKKQFAQTGSTMYQTITNNNTSSQKKRSSDLFQRAARDNIRLYSTVKCDQFPMSKFRKMNINNDSFKWKNWKFSGFPIVSETFKKNLKIKLQKSYNQSSSKDLMRVEEVRIRHKLREVAKLKEDVAKAQENNRLIKLIQNSHNGKIKAFFDQLEKYLNK